MPNWTNLIGLGTMAIMAYLLLMTPAGASLALHMKLAVILGAGALVYFLTWKSNPLAWGGLAVLAGLSLLIGSSVIGALTASGTGTSTSTLTQTQVSTMKWDVFPSTVTSGVTLTGNQFTVPLTYNSTANTVSIDPVEVLFTVNRGAGNTGQTSYDVKVSPPGSVLTDPTTGIGYDPINKDTSNNYYIYINQTSGTTIQSTERTFTFDVGTDSNSFTLYTDLAATGWNYPNNYQGATMAVNVGGNLFTIYFQKVAEVT